MEGADWKKKVYRDCRKTMFPALALGVAGDAAGELLAVYTAAVLGSFADAVFYHDRTVGLADMWELVLCLLAALVVVPALGTARELLHFANSLKHDRAVFSRYLDKTYLEGTKFTAGEAQYRLEQDPIDLRCMWLEVAMKCATLVLVLPYLVYRMVGINFTYAVLVAAVSLLKLYVPVAVRKAEARYDRQEREYRTQASSYEGEMTYRPCAVKLYGLFAPFIERFDKCFENYYRDTLRRSTACSVAAGSVLSFLDTFCLLVLLFAGTVMVAEGRITPGNVVSMVAFFPIWNGFIGRIGFLIRKNLELDNMAERVAALYSGAENFSGKSIGNVADITVEGLSFSYGDKTVIDGVSFRVRRGEKVAICGKNGSGKSTLVKILSGTLGGYQGSVRLDGEEMKGVAVKSWRSQLAFVEQDPYLFVGTIRENVHLGNQEADISKVDKVMEELGIGYLSEREVTPGGDTLSGGERQRVSLARALLKDTPFLVFDEPNNNLDSSTLEWLCGYIARSPKTVIYISHDDALLGAADKKVQL